MYQTRTAYDRGVGTFSPEGRLFQVEYAIKAIELGSCAIGVRTAFGVVLGVEKRITSPLLEQSSVEKIQEVDRHIATAISGLAADSRTLIDHARVECANHKFTYDEPLRVESLTQSVCDLKMSFGEGGDDEGKEEKKAKMSRPFGVSLLVAGCDARGPQLYHTDPSGTYVAWDAQAIGNGSEAARTILRERYAKSMSLEAAATLVVRVLAETMEEKVRPLDTSDVQQPATVNGHHAGTACRPLQSLTASQIAHSRPCFTSADHGQQHGACARDPRRRFRHVQQG